MTKKKPIADSTGVITRKKGFQIDLRSLGLGKETLRLPVTTVNRNYAIQLRANIVKEHAHGTLVLANYFPDSPRARAAPGGKTFHEFATEWLEKKSVAIEHSTRVAYQTCINSKVWKPFAQIRLGNFDESTIEDMKDALPPHGKTYNNYLSVLRLILKDAIRRKLLPVKGLLELLENRKYQRKQPDPFAPDEAYQLLACMPSPEAHDFYEFAFAAGLRPSEQIAQMWNTVDLDAARLTVVQARVRGGFKATKTHLVRTVELNEVAVAVLRRQFKRTGPDGFVFVGEDGREFGDTSEPLNTWWKPAMAASGLRVRTARQARHSCATRLLMSGALPAWAAQQMGHSLEMFLRTYARWLPAADGGFQVGRVNAFDAKWRKGTNKSAAPRPRAASRGKKDA